ncbi:MAG: hypothetical protein ACPGEF_04255 [Endozoicomonas sp.]
MTEAQYIWGWISYLAGATGCLISLWFIVRTWYPRLRRTIMFVAMALVYTPWYVNPEEGFLAPAFVISLYDGLSLGVPAMWRSGQVAVIAVIIMAVIALFLPIKEVDSIVSKKPKTNKPDSQKQRTEPSI